MKIKFIVTWCLIVILLCACSTETLTSNKKYKILKKDSNFYIEFQSNQTAEEQSENVLSHLSVGISKSYPKFNSISDMRAKILNGDISDEQIAVLQTDGTNNVLEICNPNNLYDLALPKNLAYDYILWYGDTYSFEIEDDSFMGYVFYSNEEAYNQEFSEKYSDFLMEKHSVISDTVISERNARVVHSMNDAGEFKNMFYTISTTTGDTLYVKEEYVLRYFGDETLTDTYEVSETIPANIRIFGSNGTYYYYGWLKGFEERPSVEWLSSFGLVPDSTNIAS